MAKRFTASDKWQDLWFSSLSLKHKLLWIYILDTCDHVGMFEPNFKAVEFFIGAKFNVDDVKKILADRFIEVGNKWWIPKFITFQYGELNPDVNPHKPIIKKLTLLGLYENGVLKGINTLSGFALRGKDKEQDKAQDQYECKEQDKSKDSKIDVQAKDLSRKMGVIK
jgi:hypothetical protein